jgi:protein TonB
MRFPTLRFGLVAAGHAALLLPLLATPPAAEPAPLQVFSARLIAATTAARDTPAAATPAPLKPSPARPTPPAPSLIGSTASTSSPSSMAASAPASTAVASTAVSTTSAPTSPANSPSGASAVLAEARYDAAYLHNPKPAYPPASRRGGEQGQVLLRVAVAADGSAQAVHVIAGSGFSRLDQAALEAVRRWKFVPAKRGDTPVDGVVRVPINFSLEDA